MPTLPPATSARPSPATGTAVPARLRSRRALALVMSGAVLVALGVWWIVRTAGLDPASPPSPAVVRAQQQSPVLPSGLGISRMATWDGSRQTATLSITYTTQRASLTGPFLEVLPGPAGAAQTCPPAEWQGASAELNIASATGLDAGCAWAVRVPRIQPRGEATVTADLPLTLPESDTASALQEWLDSAAGATEAATSDGQVTSTAYPAQRLTDIQVVGPSRTVSGRTLGVSLLPVWPSGPDPLHPLFRSPPSGPPAQTLVAVAGGTSGVRFADGCSGALAVSRDGLVVTAESVAEDCQVNARVGNFTDLASEPFEIATRGS